MPLTLLNVKNLDTLEFNHLKETQIEDKHRDHKLLIILGVILEAIQFLRWILTNELVWYEHIIPVILIVLILSRNFYLSHKKRRQESHQIIRILINQKVIQLISKDQQIHELNLEHIKPVFDQKQGIISLTLDDAQGKQFYFSNEKLDWSGKDLITIYNKINLKQNISLSKYLIFDQSFLQNRWISPFPYSDVVFSLIAFTHIVVSLWYIDYYLIKGYMFFFLLILLILYFQLAEKLRRLKIDESYLYILSPFNFFSNRKYDLNSLKSVDWRIEGSKYYLILELDNQVKEIRVYFSVKQIRSILYVLEKRGVRPNY